MCKTLEKLTKSPVNSAKGKRSKFERGTHDVPEGRGFDFRRCHWNVSLT